MTTPLNAAVSAGAATAVNNAMASSGAGNAASSLMAANPYSAAIGAVAGAVAPALANATAPDNGVSAANQSGQVNFTNGPVSINFGSGTISSSQTASAKQVSDQSGSNTPTPNSNGAGGGVTGSSFINGINPLYFVFGALGLIILKRKGAL